MENWYFFNFAFFSFFLFEDNFYEDFKGGTIVGKICSSFAHTFSFSIFFTEQFFSKILKEDTYLSKA